MKHTEFVDIKMHTAKCDWCNDHNRDIVHQCTICGMNYCTPCWLTCENDGVHEINAGDKGYAAALAAQESTQGMLKPKIDKGEKKLKRRSASPMPTRRRTRRRRVITIEESEDEVTGDFQQSPKRTLIDLTEPQVGKEQRSSERRRGKFPTLEIEEPTSPRAISPSNRSAGVGSITSDSINNATAEAANSLLNLAAGNKSKSVTPQPKSFGTDGAVDDSVGISTNREFAGRRESSATMKTFINRAGGPDNIICQEARRVSAFDVPKTNTDTQVLTTATTPDLTSAIHPGVFSIVQ